jgi:four helix bundle protein
MNYRNLEVWQLARELVIAIHEMTLAKLAKLEMLEEDGRIRRAIKSAKSTIGEGHGDRHYKQEFVKFVDYALASCHESADQLDTLIATKSLTDVAIIGQVTRKLNELGRKLNLFLKSIGR